jgi:hypothetical protein
MLSVIYASVVYASVIYASVIYVSVIYASVIYAECHLCLVSFILSVANKPFLLSVVMLNVVEPN